MFSCLSPLDVKNYIVYSIQPNITTYAKVKKEINACRNTAANLFLASKKLGEELKPACQKKINELYKIQKWVDNQAKMLQKKYPLYNQLYCPNSTNKITSFLKTNIHIDQRVEIPLLNKYQFLCDALSSGLQGASHTFSDYSPEIGKDIKTIVKLPSSWVFSVVLTNASL